MATNNITQTFDNVNQKISGAGGNPFDSGAGFLTGFCQIDSDQNDHRISGVFRGVMLKQILSGTNEEALALLSSVGPIGFVPGVGENSIPLNEFADFYGISEKYLTGLLTRSGFIQKLYPNDITRTYLSDIIAAKAPLTICCASQQKRPEDLATYRINGSHCQVKVSLPRRRAFSLYSPRMVLAAALKMVYTDKSGLEGSIKKTLLALKRSPYRFAKRVEDKPVEKFNQDKSAGGVPVTTNGELVLSPELLTHAIKTAVKEAVSEVMLGVRGIPAVQPASSVAAVQPQKKSFPAKLKKPDGWDDIVVRWKRGGLGVSEAAKMAGMSESSFRNYATGKSTFD